MNKKNLNKMMLVIAAILFAGQVSMANDKLPKVIAQDEANAIKELIIQWEEQHFLQSVTASLKTAERSIVVLDTEGRILEQVQFEGEMDWTSNKELRSLLGRSALMMEHQNAVYYVYDRGNEVTNVRS